MSDISGIVTTGVNAITTIGIAGAVIKTTEKAFTGKSGKKKSKVPKF